MVRKKESNNPSFEARISGICIGNPSTIFVQPKKEINTIKPFFVSTIDTGLLGHEVLITPRKVEGQTFADIAPLNQQDNKPTNR